MRTMVETAGGGRWSHGLSVAVLLTLASGMRGVCGQANPSKNEHDEALASIKEYALKYASSLPDYTCIRVTREKGLSVASRQEELTVAGKRENYKVLKAESNIPHGVKAVDEAFGTISAGEFGAVLSRIFDSETETSFHWARSGRLRGRPVVVFSFEVAGAHGARVFDSIEQRELVAGYKGLIYADAASKAVLRVETHVSDILPEKFGGVDLTLDYEAVKIGESEFVLPYRFDLEWPHRHMLIDSPGSRSPILREGPGLSVTAEYQDYRGYSAESALGFGGANSQNDIHSAISFGGIVPADKK